MALDVGTLSVKISADISELRAQLGNVTKALNEQNESVKSLGEQLTGFTKGVSSTIGTLGSKMTKMGKSLGKVFDEDASPAVRAFADAVASSIGMSTEQIESFAKSLKGAGMVLKTVGIAIGMLPVPIIIAVGAVAALEFAVRGVESAMGKSKTEGLRGVFDDFVTISRDGFISLVGATILLNNIIKDTFKEAIAAVIGYFADLAEAIAKTYGSMKDMPVIGGMAKSYASGAWQAAASMRSGAASMVAGGGGGLEEAQGVIAQIKAAEGKAKELAISTANAIGDEAKNILKTIQDAIAAQKNKLSKKDLEEQKKEAIREMSEHMKQAAQLQADELHQELVMREEQANEIRDAMIADNKRLNDLWNKNAKEVAEQLARDAAELKKAIESPKETLKAGAMDQAPMFKKSYDAAMAAKEGGPTAQFANVVATLLANSTGFAKLMERLNGVVTVVAEAVGAVVVVLEPFYPIVDQLVTIFKSISPLLVVLEAIALAPLIAILGPLVTTFVFLGKAINLLVEGINWVIYGIKAAWNGMLDAVAWVFHQLGHLPAIGGAFEDVAKFIESFKAENQRPDTKKGTVGDTLGMFAGAKDKDTQATEEHTKATKEATVAAQKFAEALTNIPTGYKVKVAQFAAQDDSDRQHFLQTGTLGGT